MTTTKEARTERRNSYEKGSLNAIFPYSMLHLLFFKTHCNRVNGKENTTYDAEQY